MKRVFVAVGLMALGVVLLRAGLEACGDKSLAAGGVRYQRGFATQHPASILIFNPTNSRIAAAAREMKLQQALRQVGHTYLEVTTIPELDLALKSGKFNVVMADVDELSAVRQQIQGSATPPAVVAVAYKLSKAGAAAASKQQKFLVKVPSRTAQYLDTITEAARSTPRKT